MDVRAASLYREITINLETLHSLSVMYSDGNLPTLHQFSIEAKKILSRHHDIQALEWVPRVLHADRSLYENENQQYFPNYQSQNENHKVTWWKPGIGMNIILSIM